MLFSCIPLKASIRALPPAISIRCFASALAAPTRYKDLKQIYKSPELLQYNDKEITVEQLGGIHAFDPKISGAFKRLGYDSLTPVQARSIVPMMVEENGVVCRAKTGTGKTMAFVIPTVQNALDYYFETKRGYGKVHSLIIAPTRDLALQIKDEYEKLLSKDRALSKIRVRLCIGGKSDSFTYAPSIMVATPGRLEANLRNPRFSALFSDLKYRVYDEADRLLDQGFEESLINIDTMLREARVKALNPTTKMRSVLFSATVDKRVDEFARNTMGDDYRYINCVPEDEPEAHENIHQTLVKTKNSYESHVAAFTDIFRNLATKPNYKAIMFVPTVSGTDYLYGILRGGANAGLIDRDTMRSSRTSILKLHGQISQGKRDKATTEFRTCKSGVLVCTDVAARGMDFKNVTDVIQICPSSEVADYVHKVGRTARAGTSGNATLYLSKSELPYVRYLQKERGIKFSKEVEYETMSEDAPEFEKIRIYEDETEDYIRSYLGFARGIISSYRLKMEDAIANISNLYRSLIKDPNAKIEISRKMFLQMGLRDPRGEYFNVPGGVPRLGGKDDRKGGFKGNFKKRGNNFGYRQSNYQSSGKFTDRIDKRYNDRNSKRTFDSRFY
ncbi:hypothetical protein ACI3LY_005099 [Candidozyma auris]|uniref:ATP-dependent RNA helicase n=2 Tax=Candidozyma auris TaxID=498019 RepID=A0A2H0ZV19_CANAR|nr:hypothetical protein QG37_05848 [[Candida] auris]PIS54527.1 hypothetical protein B9J08_002301 [[Candida] auris]QWW25929.1 hypothetical protein CA7LBN_004833 [[Candida] auris]